MRTSLLNHFRRLIALPLLIIAVVGGVFCAPLAQAQLVAPNVPQGEGLVVEPNRAGINVPIADDLRLDQAIKNIINYILGFLALLAVVIIIIAGIRLIASAGNEDAQAFAKRAITWSIIGLALIALSWSIVAFVIDVLGAGTGGAVRGTIGRGANTMEVTVNVPGSSNKVITPTGTNIDVPFSAIGQKANILINPQFDNTTLADMTKYSWEVVLYDAVDNSNIALSQTSTAGQVSNGSVTIGTTTTEPAVITPLGGNLTKVLEFSNGNVAFKDATQRSTYIEDVCTPNCSTGSPKLLINGFPQGYTLSVRLTAYNRDGDRLSANDFQIRSVGTRAGADHGTATGDPSDDAALREVRLNGRSARIDRRPSGNIHVLDVPNANGQKLIMEVFYDIAALPRTATLKFERIGGGDARFTKSTLTAEEIRGKPFELAQGNADQEAYWMTITNGDTSHTKRVLILLNGYPLSGAVNNAGGTEYADINFKIGTQTYLSNGIHQLEAPQDLDIVVNLETNSSTEFTMYRAVLDGYIQLMEGSTTTGSNGIQKTVTVKVPATSLKSGRVHTLQVLFRSTDGTVERAGVLKLAVATNPDTDTVTGTTTTLTGPTLSPRVGYTFNEKNYAHFPRELGTPLVVPVQASQAGLTLGVKTDDGKYYHYSQSEPTTSNAFSNCRWNFGRERIVEQATCNTVNVKFNDEETVNVNLSYDVLNFGRREHNFVIDVRRWGPYFTVEPAAAQMGQQISFTPEEEILDDRDLPLIRTILGLPNSAPLTRLQVRWKFYDNLEDAQNTDRTPLLTLEGDTVRHAFQASEGFAPGKNYYARIEATYTYQDQTGNKQITYWSTRMFSLLNRGPVAQFQVKQEDPERNNVYTLDGGSSYDPDGEVTVFNWSIKKLMDKTGQLTNQQYQVIADSSNKSRIPLSINEAGEYMVRLEVKDAAGLQSIREQRISQKAVLNMDFFAGVSTAAMSPDKLIVIPRPGNQDAQVIFGINNMSPEIQYLEWNYGEGTPEKTLSSVKERMYNYREAGMYRVSVTGYDANNNRVTRSKELYIPAADQPRAVIGVNFVGGPIFPLAAGQSVCTDAQGKNVNTYQITRGTQVRFDGSKSINREGTNTGLEYRWNVAGAIEKYTQSFTQQFSTMPQGSTCLPVTLTVTDTTSNKQNVSEPVYFQIVNSPPTIGAVRVVSNNVLRTPAEVRVYAENVRDADGTVTKYTWYYYEAGANPEAPGAKQGIQETSQPTALFTIPSTGAAGTISQYVFAVDVTDNEGNVTNSYKTLGDEGSTLTLTNSPPPVLTLDLMVTPAQTKVGSSVTFRATARQEGTNTMLSGGFYSYDINGDGIYDFLNQGPTFTYRYTGEEQMFQNIQETTTIPLTVKAQVFYRNQLAEASAQIRVIKEVSKPVADFEYRVVDNRVFFVNKSKGTGLSYEWDLDVREGVTCAARQGFTRDANIAAPSKVYPAVGNGTYKAMLVITDQNKLTSCIEKEIYLLRSSAPPEIQLQADIFGKLVRFRNQGDPGKQLSYAWYFNTGQGNQCANSGTGLLSKTPDSMEATPTYTYSAPGTYHVAVLASDQYGSTQCAERDILTTEAANVAGQSGGLHGAAPSKLQLQVGRPTLRTGEALFLRATLVDNTGAAISEPIYSFDVDANTNPGDDIANVNRVGETVYTYDRYAANFQDKGNGTQEATFTVIASANYQGVRLQSDPVTVTVVHDALRSAESSINLSSDKQTAFLGEPVSFQFAVPEQLQGRTFEASLDVNNDGIFDITTPGSQITYRFTGKEFTGVQETYSTRVQGRLRVDNRDVLTNLIPLQVKRSIGGDKLVFGVELIPSQQRVIAGTPVIFHAQALASDGTAVVDRKFSYDLDGDGRYEFTGKGDKVQYNYSYEQFKSKFRKNGGVLEATFQPRVKVQLDGKELTSPAVPLTVIAKTASTLTPEVHYISPNPGPYVENALTNKEILVPLEAASSTQGITLKFAEISNSRALTAFQNQVTWKVGERTYNQTITQPLTLQLPEVGNYPVTVQYTLSSGEAVLESFTIRVLPWFGQAVADPTMPSSTALFRLAVTPSIVESDWDTLREHRGVLPSTPIAVLSQGWTITALNNETPLYTTTEREIEGTLADMIPADKLAQGGTYRATYEYVLQVAGEVEPLVYTTSTEFTVTSTPPVPALVWYQRDSQVPERYWLDGRQTLDSDPADTLRYRWTITQDGEEIDQESNADGVFVWTAPRTGLYDVMMTVTDSSNATASVTEALYVTDVTGGATHGAAQDVLENQKASFQYLALTGGRVIFRSDARGDVLTTFWDLDTSVDADGDQDPANDIEAEQEIFEATYTQAGSYPVQMTITDADGLTYKKTQLIEARDGDRASLRTQALGASLQTLPLATAQGTVVVRDDAPVVVFVPSDSTGELVSYAIDVDTGFDSDGDGQTDNDVDNSNHESYSTGDPFSYAYDPSIGGATAKLTVTDTRGQSRTATVALQFVGTSVLEPGHNASESYINTIQTIDPSERQERITSFMDAINQLNISNLRKNYFQERLDQLASADLSPYDREVIRRELEREIDELLISTREKAILKALLDEIPLTNERVSSVPAKLLTVDEIIEQIQQRIRGLNPRTRLDINKSLLKIQQNYDLDRAVVETEVQTIRDLISAAQLEQNLQVEINGFLDLLADQKTEEETPVETPDTPEDPTQTPETPTGETPDTETPSTEQPAKGLDILGVFLGILKFAAIIFGILLGLGVLLFLSYLFYKNRSGKTELEFEEYVLHLRTYLGDLFKSGKTTSEENTPKKTTPSSVEGEIIEAQPVGEVPSWLQLDGSTETPSPTTLEHTELPPWMVEEPSTETPLTSAANTETPSWMDEEPVVTPEPSTPPVETPPWAQTDTASTPSWLQLDDTPAPAVTPLNEEPTQIAEAPASEDTLIPEQTTQATEKTTSIELPDWLKEDAPEINTEATPEATSEKEEETPLEIVPEQVNEPVPAPVIEPVVLETPAPEPQTPTEPEVSEQATNETEAEKPKRRKYTTPADVFPPEEGAQEVFSDFIGFDDPEEIAKREQPTPPTSTGPKPGGKKPFKKKFNKNKPQKQS